MSEQKVNLQEMLDLVNTTKSVGNEIRKLLENNTALQTQLQELEVAKNKDVAAANEAKAAAIAEVAAANEAKAAAIAEVSATNEAKAAATAEVSKAKAEEEVTKAEAAKAKAEEEVTKAEAAKAKAEEEAAKAAEAAKSAETETKIKEVNDLTTKLNDITDHLTNVNTFLESLADHFKKDIEHAEELTIFNNIYTGLKPKLEELAKSTQSAGMFDEQFGGDDLFEIPGEPKLVGGTRKVTNNSDYATELYRAFGGDDVYIYRSDSSYGGSRASSPDSQYTYETEIQSGGDDDSTDGDSGDDSNSESN
jgi:chemotaxis protein histidine kinase CheA